MPWPLTTLTIMLLVLGTNVTVLHAKEVSKPIRELLTNRCVQCHDESRSGGPNLQTLLADTAAQEPADVEEQWEAVERVIVSQRMPPADESPLSKEQRTEFHNWFQAEYVLPGGQQIAGTPAARRLTRAELQNTLEDILHVPLRVTVTNSRLHVIPDSIVEKFFTHGVVGESGFSNDAETLAQEPIDIRTYARCFKLILAQLDSRPAARKILFGQEELPTPATTEDIKRWVNDFGRSAFRRELTSAESAAFQRVYSTAAENRTSYEAIKSAYLAMLLSPPFLYRFESPVQAPQEKGKASLLDDRQLAVRLSYFLWSAPPDETLRQLADAGKLRERDVIRQQVRRMLDDPRRAALTENLGGEWFDYQQLRQKSAVNKRSDRMAGFYRTQYEEAALFFDSILRYDQSIFSLIDADWVYINRHQAGIYRWQAKPKKFEGGEPLAPIKLHYRGADRDIAQGNYEYKHAPLSASTIGPASRGGFLTLGPTMSVTSTANRTSPIRRGVWVLERILGMHFEVPEDVPDLEESQKKAKGQNLTAAEVLKLHSSQQGCAACHKYIDPIGFGLEVFDQLGVSRPSAAASPLAGQTQKWTPKQTPRPYADRSWKLAKPLTPGATTRVQFQYTKGRHRLNIRKVRLTAGDIQLNDNHFGFTGNAQRDNVWNFDIPSDAPATGWTLTAEVEGDGGKDSHGTITIAGPNDQSPAFQLPNGNEFRSPLDLKRRLLEDYRDDVINNSIRRVLAYALGRKTRPIDRPAIEQIRKELAANDYRMQALLEAVAVSFPFRHIDTNRSHAQRRAEIRTTE